MIDNASVLSFILLCQHYFLIFGPGLIRHCSIVYPVLIQISSLLLLHPSILFAFRAHQVGSNLQILAPS